MVPAVNHFMNMGAVPTSCKAAFTWSLHARGVMVGRPLTKNDSKMSNAKEMKTDDVLRVELEVFRAEHRDLDEAIHALEESGRADQLRLRRLKKQKLALKDKITRIEDQLTPDIIA